MIDPVHSLAFSVHSNPGVYAVLLGSGVSRAARVPTGWEITLDLVRRLAALDADDCDPDPEQWYRQKFGKSPEYSEILDVLAKTPAERQQLLRGYWEPNELEREEGAKRPTAAHGAIAALVAQGFVKVIITTNFDRLMESALAESGVVPTVLSSPDQVQGALPLIHTRCCVFKVHGDYLDTRIRNTPGELASYPPEFDLLLDRIFDEFGLLVCGWSAVWDEALRAALFRASSRRFTTYWALRGDASDEAQRLIDHRGAQVVRITDADTFLKSVQQNVESLEEFSRPHPLSTEAAVASLKRYLSEPRYRIQLADLVDETVSRILEITSSPKFDPNLWPAPSSESATARVRGYEAACSTLLPMASIGGYWGEDEHLHVWLRALDCLSGSLVGGHSLWRKLQRYPGTLLLYALGVGALASDRLVFLGRLLTATVPQEDGKELPAARVFPPFCWMRPEEGRLLEGMERRHAPLNDWLHATLRQATRPLVPREDRHTLLFDKLEILIALGYRHAAAGTTSSGWFPPGSFGYRHEARNLILGEIEESVSKLGKSSPYVRCGIFGASPEGCAEALKDFRIFAERLEKEWW